MRKALATLLMLVMCLCIAGNAAAEIEFLPQVAKWDLSLPLEVELSADVTAHMPFDDERCAQLNALLKHVSLKLSTAGAEGEQLSRAAVRVDGKEALALVQQTGSGQTRTQFSFQPGVAYVSKAESAIQLYGLDGGEHAWLDDGYALLNAIHPALESYKKQTSIKTAIKNMGTARTKITYTIPKDDAGKMAEAIAAHCPDGELKQFLGKLVFSGQQKLIFWLTGNGDMIRAEFAGNCGVDENSLRKVSMVWRMRRDDTAIRDDLVIKTPAVKGTDYNTLNYDREIVKGKKSKLNYDSEFTYTWKAGKEKTTLSAQVDLTNTPSGQDARLTGTITVKQTLPGADASTSLKISPDVLIGGDEGTPDVSGVVTVQELRGKNVLEQAAITVKAGAGTYFDWQEPQESIDAASMTQAQQQELLAGMSQALIPHLVVLPQEDVLYLSADLAPEVWQQIVEAAQQALAEEVAP